MSLPPVLKAGSSGIKEINNLFSQYNNDDDDDDLDIYVFL